MQLLNMIYIKILLVIIWLLVGAASLVYWTTKKRNITIDDIPLIIVLSFYGVFSFIIGWLTYGEPVFKDKVIFKKRNK